MKMRILLIVMLGLVGMSGKGQVTLHLVTYNENCYNVYNSGVGMNRLSFRYALLIIMIKIIVIEKGFQYICKTK
ncbi:MAG: hypothetical protein WCL14_11225 [Bacteroidota bacterium]